RCRRRFASPSCSAWPARGSRTPSGAVPSGSRCRRAPLPHHAGGSGGAGRAVVVAERRGVGGVERGGQLREATGLREGEGYAAGGPPGVVRLAAAAHEGVLGLLGVAALPPD